MCCARRVRVRVGHAANARGRALERFVREAVGREGTMPSGKHTVEWQFMNSDPRTFTVDFDALADRAEEARRGALG